MRPTSRALSIGAVAGAGIIAACLGGNANLATVFEAISVTDPVPFGDVLIGTSSPAQIITISPSTTMDESFTITAIVGGSTCTNFTVDGSGIIGTVVSHTCIGSGTGAATTPNIGGCTDVTQAFPAYFHPQVAGPDSCTVVIKTSGPTLTTQLTGNGVAPDFALAVAPSPLSFGDVPLATQGTRTLDFKNVGGKPVRIDSVTSGDPRIAISDVTGLLASGNTQAGTVTCTPGMVEGLITTTLQVGVTPGGTTLTGVPVTVTCNAIDSALLATPTSVTMPSTMVGVPVTSNVVVSIKPGTTGTVLLTSAAIVNDMSNGELSVTAVGIGLPSTISLRYTAVTMHPNGDLATLEVNYTLDGVAAKFNIAVSGEALPGSLGLDPSAVDLGPVCAGGSATAPVNAFANSAATIEITLVDAPDSPFTFDKPAGMAYPLVLPGAHGRDVMFTATVAPSAPGPLTSLAHVHTNIPQTPAQDVMLKAMALPAGIAATPTMVDFGVVSATIASTPSETVVLTNCSGGDLVVSGYHIDGPASNEFGVVNGASQPVARTLAPRESEEILVSMAPRKPGAKNAQLVIEHSAGQSQVDLDGSVTGGAGGGDDSHTYYDCSAGRPGSLWPMALALFAIRRRRR